MARSLLSAARKGGVVAELCWLLGKDVLQPHACDEASLVIVAGRHHVRICFGMAAVLAVKLKIAWVAGRALGVVDFVNRSEVLTAPLRVGGVTTDAFTRATLPLGTTNLRTAQALMAAAKDLQFGDKSQATVKERLADLTSSQSGPAPASPTPPCSRSGRKLHSFQRTTVPGRRGGRTADD